MDLLFPEHVDYAFIRERLVVRVQQSRAAGHPSADADEQVVLEHDTSARRRGRACDACGHPWPCGSVMSVLGFG
jgi:hypothetical protein